MSTLLLHLIGKQTLYGKVMCELTLLKQNNRVWADAKCQHDPEFFQRLALQQHPDYLWIGCSDSRVPANDIVGLEPGELFVHRNIANAVQDNDFNCLSVLQYAVEVLKVKHVIVCGHYGCGGIQAAMGNEEHGLVDNWLRQIKDLYVANKVELDLLPEQDQVNRLCELNVVNQVSNLSKTKVVQHAWQRGQSLSIHGWIYGLKDGLVKDLNVSLSQLEQVDPCYRLAPTQRGARPEISTDKSLVQG